MNEKFLPIGTVCRLKDAARSLMIIGFCVSKEDDNKVYDYFGCIYPEGVIDQNINFLFDHDQIAEIIHKGLESEQQQELNNTLKKYLNDLKDRDNFYNADQPLNSSVSKETTLNTMNLMEENNE